MSFIYKCCITIATVIFMWEEGLVWSVGHQTSNLFTITAVRVHHRQTKKKGKREYVNIKKNDCYRINITMQFDIKYIQMIYS